jgi:hypothetical protein
VDVRAAKNRRETTTLEVAPKAGQLVAAFMWFIIERDDRQKVLAWIQ